MANDQPGDIAAAIREKVRVGMFEFSEHATDQTIVRGIRVQEVREAMAACEIIENYPDDKYGPSCLMLGFTTAKRPLHVHCSYPSRPIIKLITLYEPDPSRWLEFKVRRRNGG